MGLNIQLNCRVPSGLEQWKWKSLIQPLDITVHFMPEFLGQSVDGVSVQEDEEEEEDCHYGIIVL